MLLNPFDKSEFSTAVRARLKNTRELPPMPEVAHDLLRLRNKPNADVLDLVNIVERDPSLASQVMRVAYFLHLITTDSGSNFWENE